MAKHKSSGGLGFRNFRDFNIAILGKQGWCFIINPDSLVSRLFKAKYFADGDYLKAKLGNNPSFIWRNVFEEKNLLRDGVWWRVGNGEKIKVLGQPWLVTGPNPFITTISPVIDEVNVTSLLCTDNKEWDVDVIKDVFNSRDQRSILEVQLDDANEEDELFWHLKTTGVNSVKSAYKFLQVQRGEWNIVDNSSTWKLLWRIKAPPKALNVVWRALSGCLPTLSQLQIKHVPFQNWCPNCNGDVETVLHCLVTCPFAQQCWLTLNPTITTFHFTDFTSWLSGKLATGVGNQRVVVIVLCWAIWRARNDLVWN